MLSNNTRDTNSSIRLRRNQIEVYKILNSYENIYSNILSAKLR